MSYTQKRTHQITITVLVIFNDDAVCIRPFQTKIISSQPSPVIKSSRNKITSSFKLDCIVLFCKDGSFPENGFKVKSFHNCSNECYKVSCLQARSIGRGDLKLTNFELTWTCPLPHFFLGGGGIINGREMNNDIEVTCIRNIMRLTPIPTPNSRQGLGFLWFWHFFFQKRCYVLGLAKKKIHGTKPICGCCFFFNLTQEQYFILSANMFKQDLRTVDNY